MKAGTQQRKHAMSRKSPALRFITCAKQDSRHKDDDAAMAALRLAIAHRMKFGIDDARDISAAVGGLGEFLYHQAIESGNSSFLPMYEKRVGMRPWMWPTALIHNRKSSSVKSRLSVGSRFWFYTQKSKLFRLWKVTGMSDDRLTACVTSDRDGWGDEAKKRPRAENAALSTWESLNIDGRR